MEDIQPIRIDTSKKTEKKRVPLFYIDDVEYTIPTEVSPSTLFKYLKAIRSGNMDRALSTALYDILGEKAMNDLATCEELTFEDTKKIMGAAEGLLYKGIDDLGGKPPEGL